MKQRELLAAFRAIERIATSRPNVKRIAREVPRAVLEDKLSLIANAASEAISQAKRGGVQ